MESIKPLGKIKSRNFKRYSNYLYQIFDDDTKKGNIFIINGLKYKFDGKGSFYIEKNTKKSADKKGLNYIKAYKTKILNINELANLIGVEEEEETQNGIKEYKRTPDNLKELSKGLKKLKIKENLGKEDFIVINGKCSGRLVSAISNEVTPINTFLMHTQVSKNTVLPISTYKLGKKPGGVDINIETKKYDDKLIVKYNLTRYPIDIEKTTSSIILPEIQEGEKPIILISGKGPLTINASIAKTYNDLGYNTACFQPGTGFVTTNGENIGNVIDIELEKSDVKIIKSGTITSETLKEYINENKKETLNNIQDAILESQNHIKENIITIDNSNGAIPNRTIPTIVHGLHPKKVILKDEYRETVPTNYECTKIDRKESNNEGINIKITYKGDKAIISYNELKDYNGFKDILIPSIDSDKIIFIEKDYILEDADTINTINTINTILAETYAHKGKATLIKYNGEYIVVNTHNPNFKLGDTIKL